MGFIIVLVVLVALWFFFRNFAVYDGEITPSR